jgi:hypothetical protein
VKIPRPISGQVEIVRSFSYKLNVGSYESRDFFCSQKTTCDADDAEAISELVYQFCKTQVLKSVVQYKAECHTAEQQLVAKKAELEDKWSQQTGKRIA